jgi:hypothetical protein
MAMIRRACLCAVAGLLSGALAGCSSNPENDPLLAVFTAIAYAAAIGFFSFLIYRAIWGPQGPR